MKLCTKHTHSDMMIYWWWMIYCVIDTLFPSPLCCRVLLENLQFCTPKAAQLFKILQTGKNANAKITIATKIETRVETAWRFHIMKTISEMWRFLGIIVYSVTQLLLLLTSAVINHQRVTARKEAVWVKINVENIKTNKLFFIKSRTLKTKLCSWWRTSTLCSVPLWDSVSITDVRCFSSCVQFWANFFKE